MVQVHDGAHLGHISETTLQPIDTTQSHCGSAAALAPYMYNRASETYDYTVVHNDRHHNKRQRESSSPQNTDHNTTVDQVRASLGARPKQTGQSTASSRPDLPKIVGKSINESIKLHRPKFPNRFIALVTLILQSIKILYPHSSRNIWTYAC